MSRTFDGSVVLSPPFVMQKEGGGFEGFVVDILDKIAESTNFSYKLHLSRDGTYGSMDSRGNWRGMIGEVVRQERDFAAGDLVMTSSRERVVDFTKPFMSTSARLLVRKPLLPDSSIEIGAFLQPFSTEVWICILIAAFVVALLLMLIGRFNPNEWRQVPADKDPRGARNSFGLRDSLMFVFSTLMLQGYRETPRSLSGRTLAVSWFSFALLSIAAYIGNINAFLHVAPKGMIPYSNIEDLTKQTSVKVGVVKSGSIDRWLQDSKIEVYERLHSFIRSSNSYVNTTREGIERVKKSEGRFVMLLESSYGDYAVKNELPCTLMMYGPSLYQKGLGFAVNLRNTDLRNMLNLAILRLKEEGTLQFLKKKWFDTGRCPDMDEDVISKSNQNGPYSTQLTLRIFAAPFIILLLGAILSVLLLGGEFAFRKFRS